MSYQEATFTLAELAGDLAKLIQRDECNLLPLLTGEVEPSSIELIWRAKDVSSRVFKDLQKDSQKNSVYSDSKESIAQQEKTPVADNFSCTLCPSRLFSIQNFRRKGTIPVIFLYYTGFVKGKFVRKDQSREYIFGGSKQDDLFARFLNKLGLSLDSFYYQEYPACYFNPIRNTMDDWERYIHNCSQHVGKTIQDHNIQKAIICGNSAILSLGTDNAQRLAKSAKSFPCDFGSITLETLVLRSPDAILAMEAKREEAKREEKSLPLSGNPEDTTKQSYQNFLQEEQDVKSLMLTSLKDFLSEFL